MQKNILRVALSLLDNADRYSLFTLLIVSLVSGLSAGAMVASLIPFLDSIAQTTLPVENQYYSFAKKFFEISSYDDFVYYSGSFALFMVFFSSFMQILRLRLSSVVCFKLLHKITYNLFKVYTNKSIDFYVQNNSSNLEEHINIETEQVVNHFFKPLINLFSSIFSILSTLGVLLWFEPGLTLFTIILFSIFYAIVVLLVGKRVENLGAKRVYFTNKRMKLTSETFRGFMDFIFYDRKELVRKIFYNVDLEKNRISTYISIISEVPGLILQALSFGGMILIALFLLSQPLDADGSGGGVITTLGLFAVAGQRAIPEFQRVYNSYTLIVFSKPSLVLLADCLNSEKQSQSNLSDMPFDTFQMLDLCDVSFKFHDDEDLVLKNITLSINALDKVGIIGKSGSGKSTLISLLLSLRYPTCGQLLINGQPLDTSNATSWRKSVGYVPQNVFLLDGSVAENVAMEDKNKLDIEKVKKVCSIAQLDNFIEQQLNNGYDSNVGENGVKLSGGQRQRIAIARALYRDPAVIIFDEATSALDSQTETEIIEMVTDIKHVTIVMVAHRLSTLNRCNKIFSLQNGECTVGYNTDIGNV